ncbi:MAG: efflux RND transporter periplasmic adaptor subunit [Pseudomonadota bacterium]
MPRSVITAGLILFLILAYFGVRTLTRGDDSTAGDSASASAAVESSEPPEVVVQSVGLQPHTAFASLKGRTEPERAVTVRSATVGVVAAAPARQGRIVREGAELCRLDVDAREVELQQAEANLASKTLDWEAASELAEKGWTSSTSAAAAKAAYDAAAAGVDAAKIELERTIIRAPFTGVFEERLAEVGDFLSPGSPCGRVLDLSPILVVVEATEAQTSRIAEGQKASVSLADGRTVEGTVSYVARTANESTRTFRVELSVPNPNFEIAAGLTASLRLAMGEAAATQVSPAMLVLSDDGQVGLRYVDSNDVVQFARIEIVDDAETGIWVTGIPENARIMAPGQDFVGEGVTVRPIETERL